MNRLVSFSKRSQAANATLEDLKRRVNNDPDRVARLIKVRKTQIEKASMTKPIQKPITDHYVPYMYRKTLEDQQDERARSTKKEDIGKLGGMPVEKFTELEEKILLEKWSTYQTRLMSEQRNRMNEFRNRQIEALEELKECSEYLYEKACQPDNNIKIKFKGAAHFIPKKDYEKNHVPIGEVKKIME